MEVFNRHLPTIAQYDAYNAYAGSLNRRASCGFAGARHRDITRGMRLYARSATARHALANGSGKSAPRSERIMMLTRQDHAERGALCRFARNGVFKTPWSSYVLPETFSAACNMARRCRRKVANEKGRQAMRPERQAQGRNRGGVVKMVGNGMRRVNMCQRHGVSGQAVMKGSARGQREGVYSRRCSERQAGVVVVNPGRRSEIRREGVCRGAIREESHVVVPVRKARARSRRRAPETAAVRHAPRLPVMATRYCL